MATVTTRTDDQTKTEAEKIADEIGITLSAAMNIFLKRFIAEKGFPFDVVASKTSSKSVIDADELNKIVKKAVAEASDSEEQKFTYLDPITKQMTTMKGVF